MRRRRTEIVIELDEIFVIRGRQTSDPSPGVPSVPIKRNAYPGSSGNDSRPQPAHYLSVD